MLPMLKVNMHRQRLAWRDQHTAHHSAQPRCNARKTNSNAPVHAGLLHTCRAVQHAVRIVSCKFEVMLEGTSPGAAVHLHKPLQRAVQHAVQQDAGQVTWW
jgi:hypothetical protein